MTKRRKHGEGTLRLRSDGRWEGRVVVNYDEKGKPITKNVTAKTKTECAQKFADYMAAADQHWKKQFRKD